MADLTMIEMSPESFAKNDLKDGLISPEQYQDRVIEYYRHFVRGKNAQIERLNGVVSSFREEIKDLRGV